MHEGIELALDIKFGTESTPLMSTVRQITDEDRLRHITAALRTVSSLDEVRQLLDG